VERFLGAIGMNLRSGTLLDRSIDGAFEGANEI
jgi:hypothetical protein